MSAALTLPSWLRMSVERYAELVRSTGAVVFKEADVWWSTRLGLFHRPLLPYRKYDRSAIESQITRPGIHKFAVSHRDPHNCYFNFAVFDELSSYDEKRLSTGVRRNLKSAMKNGIAVSRITNPETLALKAYPVYLSAYARNNYGANTRWGKQRRNPAGFAQWIQALFEFPETIVLGAFTQNELISFEIAWLVEDTLILSTVVHSDKGLELRSPDLLLHAWRTTVKHLPGVNVIWEGPLSYNGVDEFKIRRGARAIALPAYVKVNPLTLRTLRHVWPRAYHQLAGRSPGDSLPGGRTLEPSHDAARGAF